MSAASEDIALALQTRLPDLNRTVLTGTIERVLDSYSTPGRHIRIDRLSLDLGTITLGRNFAEDVSARLEQELRRALDEAIRELEGRPSEDRFVRSAEEARLDVLEHYLTSGTLPFWTDASAFELEATVTETAAETPDALVRLLRRHRHETQVIRRLVAQLGDEGLRRLLVLIDPGSAGPIAAEIEVARRDDHRFATWVRVLTDVVYERRAAIDTAAAEPRLLERGSSAWSDRDGSAATPRDAPDLYDAGHPDLSRGGHPDLARDELPALSRDGLPDRSRDERPDLARYDRAEALRYYLRYGILPWTAALAPGAAGGGPLTIEALLDALPGLPPSVLRAILPAPPAERVAALLHAAERMSADTRARLLVALWTEAEHREVAVDSPQAAAVIDQPTAYVRTILRLLDGGVEHRGSELGAWSSGVDETVDWSRRTPPDDLPALRSDVQWIKSVLAERARGGQRAGPSGPSSAALLQLLVEDHPADALHFFRVLRSAGIAPATLLTEPVSPRLFASSLMMLPGRTGTLVLFLLRLVSRLPAHEQPGDEDRIRTAAMGAVLDHLIVAGRAESAGTETHIGAGVLRALFGLTIAADTVRELAADAARLTHGGEATREALDAFGGALAVMGYAASAGLQSTSTETGSETTFAQKVAQLPPAAARRLTSLVTLLAAWPPGERPADDGEIRSAIVRGLDEVTGDAPLGAAFLAGVLRAVLGPRMTAAAVRRLLEDADHLALRGELTRDDLEAVSEAAASLVDVRVQDSPEAERLAAELARRVDGRSHRGSDVPSSASLLHTLVERFPREARVFLEKTREAGFSPSTLLAGATAPELLEAGVGLLRPLDRRLMALMLRLVSILPAADRPGSDESMRTTLAGVVLDHAGSSSGGEALAAVALRALFGPTVPVAVQRRLVAEAERVARAGQFGPDAVTVVLRVLGRPEDARVDIEGVGDSSRAAALAVTDVPIAADHAPSPMEKSAAAKSLMPAATREAAKAPESPVATGEPAAPAPGFSEGVSDERHGPLPGAAAALTRLRGPDEVVEEAPSRGEQPPAATSEAAAAPPGFSEGVSDERHGPLPGEAAALTRLRGPDEVVEEAPSRGEQPPAATSEAAAAPPAFSEPVSEERPGALPAEAAAALSRLRGPDHAVGEAPSRGEQPAAPRGDEGSTPPPRLYRPGRSPRPGQPVVPSRSDEQAAPLHGPPDTAARPRTPGNVDRLSDDALRHILLELIDTAPAAVREVLLEGLADRSVRDRWVSSFTEPELARMTWLLEPTYHRMLIAAAELLFTAWDNAAPRGRADSTTRTALWSVVLEVLSRQAEGERSIEILAREFFAQIGVRLAEPGAPFERRETAERVFGSAVTLAGRKGHAHLRAVLSQDREALMALATGQEGSLPADSPERMQHARPPSSEGAGEPGTEISARTPPPPARRTSASRPSRQRTAFSMDEDEPEPGDEPIHIANAGLVIVGAFLPHLFTTLDLLEETSTGGTRVRADAVSRAVHMLQYLVDGRTDAPEPLLCLNKVLCGVPLAVAIDREIEMTARERELCDTLLAAVLERWTIIKDSSIAALRETFLQREGRLDRLEMGWRLRVQRKTLDALLDHITWPLSTIANSWMAEPLHVTW